MKRILILGAPVFQIEVIKKAKEMGFYVGAVDINENAPGLSYADETFICSIRDHEKVMRIAQEFHPDGIMVGACDIPVVTGSKVSKTLGLPGPEISSALKSTDKVKMLEAFEAHNVPHPIFKVVKRKDISAFTHDIPYPLITKPTDSSGGRGVYIAHNKEELIKAIEFSSLAGVSGDVLLEEYMKGPEVSVEVLVVDGEPHIIQITDKITSGEPNFFEIGHSQPSALSQKEKKAIAELASRAVLSVGLKNSPAHVETIITKDGPKMVELGARLGADCITSYLTEASVSGINMTEVAIKLCLGIKPNISGYKNSGVCSSVKFIPAKEGILKTVSGVEEAEAMEGVKKVCVLGERGKNYSSATDDSARFGYVVCTGVSTEEALQKCEAAIKRISFELE